MVEDKEYKYVTFRWLIGTSLTILGIVIVLIGIISSIVTKTIDTKVDSKVYISEHTTLCSDIDSIKNSQERTRSDIEAIRGAIIRLEMKK